MSIPTTYKHPYTLQHHCTLLNRIRIKVIIRVIISHACTPASDPCVRTGVRVRVSRIGVRIKVRTRVSRIRDRVSVRIRARRSVRIHQGENLRENQGKNQSVRIRIRVRSRDTIRVRVRVRVVRVVRV